MVMEKIFVSASSFFPSRDRETWQGGGKEGMVMEKIFVSALSFFSIKGRRKGGRNGETRGGGKGEFGQGWNGDGTASSVMEQRLRVSFAFLYSKNQSASVFVPFSPE